MCRSFRSRRSASRDKQYGAVRVPPMNSQTVAVNLTLCLTVHMTVAGALLAAQQVLTSLALQVLCSPTDIMPTTTAIIEQYISSLIVGYQLDDVEDDDAWSSSRCRRPRALACPLDQIRQADVFITIGPVTRHTLGSTWQTVSIAGDT